MRIIKYFGWEECSFEQYNEACLEYGYNNESSPYYISFILDKFKDLKFLMYQRNHTLLGSVCLDRKWVFADSENSLRFGNKLPISTGCVLVPFHKDCKCIAPFKSTSVCSTNTFVNSFFSRKKSYKIKSLHEFSDFFKRNIENEIAKFLNLGGLFVDIQSIESDVLYNAYLELYYTIQDKNLNKLFFTECKEHFIGDIILINGKIVGIQLCLSSNSKDLYIDCTNLVVDKEYGSLQLKDILMWHNLNKFIKYSRDINKRLIYSYNNVEELYKKSWCKQVNLKRIIY